MRSLPALLKAIDGQYAKGHTAYWLPPIIATSTDRAVGRIRSGDSVIFCCRRGEREIQLTEAFTVEDFSAFEREWLDPLTFVPFVTYHPKFRHLPIAFPTAPITGTLGAVISDAGLTQLRAAEGEKLAHVTYFLNGKRPEPFPRESRQSVKSNLDQPLESLPELSRAVCAALHSQEHNFVCVNIASGDLVGHSEDLTIKEACAQAVDTTLGQLLASAKQAGYTVMITADHGLLEDHGLPGELPNTSHTTHPVPFICVPAESEESVSLRSSGTLADVAPTVLAALGLAPSQEMVGSSLFAEGATRTQHVLLVILDGWGLPESGHINPIANAETPTWDRLQRLDVSALDASGQQVGLLHGRKGNSESGHMAIGAGRPLTQDDVRIQQAIQDGSFKRNSAFRQAFEDARDRGGAIHLIAMLSKSSSHGSADYAIELCRLARDYHVSPVYLHAISDGRSSRSHKLPTDLAHMAEALDDIGCGEIVTLVGRGLALDRGGSYRKKTQPTYAALVNGSGAAANLDC